MIFIFLCSNNLCYFVVKNVMTKGKNIRISNDTYDHLRNSLPPIFKLSKFVENAINEKIERDRVTEKIMRDTFPMTVSKADHLNPF